MTISPDDLRAIEDRANAATDARAIPGFGRYTIDPLGRVFSAYNWRGYGCIRLHPAPNSNGYLRVRCVGDDGSRKSLFVHKVACSAFHGPKPSPRHEIRHLNGDKTDNRADNLAWGTRKENAADREAHGRTARGSRNGFAKLTEKQVVEIRESPETGKDIAKRLGVSASTVTEARRGARWKHVTTKGVSV